ncbi:type II toxin-antitoxin system RelE/ParE family toxin [Thioalkalivibrio sulfidiphilus]|uniref:type II toxin-antitoxin system RelE/ParE family toxin n=1 Tax=Thioalkalivibrio sulfidiphilus TaxID=1033854 RepID=UPI003BB01434
MKSIWTAEAMRDREVIFEYVARDNPMAAIKLDECFGEAVALLATHPHLGKEGLVSGTREFIPHESYRLIYEVDADTLWILAVVHTARCWPPVRG